MYTYTIEELLQLKPSETLPVNFDATEFKVLIEKIKMIQQLREEEYLSHHHQQGQHPHGHNQHQHPYHNGHGHFHHHGGPNHGKITGHYPGGKPKGKYPKHKVTTDEEGWTTFESKKEGTAGSSEELREGTSSPVSVNAGVASAATAAAASVEGSVEPAKVPTSVTPEPVRMKPNNRNIGSNRPADVHDIVADKPTKSFNAFDALQDDVEDEDEDEGEEEKN